MNRKVLLSFLIALVFLALITFNNNTVFAQVKLQQPTGSVPTVTGTPRGVTVTVPLDQEYVNVRTGPGVMYELVGRLVAGQEAAVLGRSEHGDWLLIQYYGGPENQGWVYSPPVSVSAGEVPIVEIPPTQTPLVTETINPTLAAQFLTTPIPTRLATYTPGEALVVPTYVDVSRSSFLGGIPMGLVILIIAGIGVILALLSIIRSR
jgi:uncharacterized protein YraI